MIENNMEIQSLNNNFGNVFTLVKNLSILSYLLSWILNEKHDKNEDLLKFQNDYFSFFQ